MLNLLERWFSDDGFKRTSIVNLYYVNQDGRGQVDLDDEDLDAFPSTFLISSRLSVDYLDVGIGIMFIICGHGYNRPIPTSRLSKLDKR